MDRIIQQITERYLSQLPEEKEYYRISDLESYGFPDFLRRRIRIGLAWNLDESMELPQTDWANMQSEAVLKSWSQFLQAIRAEVRLAASYARPVVEAALSDIIKILVRPRENITDVLFTGENVLSAAALAERINLLVVYPHFAQVLSEYMNRKNKDELARGQCKKIITQVDKKVTRRYSPLQWAQMLDPLFVLTDMQVDADLFRLFFEDRDMQPTAKRFGRMDEALGRAEFIEVLTSPDQSEKSEIEEKEEQSNLFAEDSALEQQTGKEISVEELDSAKPSNKKSSLSEIEIDDSEEEIEDPEQKKGASEAKAGEKNIEKEKRRSEPEIAEPEPNFEVYPEHEEELEEREPSSLNDIFSGEEPEEEEQEKAEFPKPTVSDSYSSAEPEEQKKESEASIWQRFMDNDPETDSEVGAQEWDQPGKTISEEEKLEMALADDEDYFIHELFDGSEWAYRKSLTEIAQQDSWKEASTLIRQNIFERNQINIYSEAAVDFTDRLQTYFEEK